MFRVANNVELLIFLGYIQQQRSTIGRLANLHPTLSSSYEPVHNEIFLDEAFAEEVIGTEGEWTGGTKRFWAPLQISVGGSTFAFGRFHTLASDCCRFSWHD